MQRVHACEAQQHSEHHLDHRQHVWCLLNTKSRLQLCSPCWPLCRKHVSAQLGTAIPLYDKPMHSESAYCQTTKLVAAGTPASQTVVFSDKLNPRLVISYVIISRAAYACKALSNIRIYTMPPLCTVDFMHVRLIQLP